MKELNKTNRLTIVVVAIVLVFVTGLLTLRKPEISYKLSPAQSIELAGDSNSYVSPAKALQIIASADGKTILIDVRNSIAFDKGHLKDAKNIPVRELFFKENLAFFEELDKAGQYALIYGETPQQAIGPYMMLKQTGLDHVLVLNGTYAQLIHSDTGTLTPKACLQNELPMIDTAALRKLTAPVVVEDIPVKKPQPVKKVVIPVKTAPSSGGGC